MNTEQIKLIKSSFEEIKRNSANVSKNFYKNLFEKNPELRPLFKGDIDLQEKKLMDMIAVAVSNIDNLEQVILAVRDLGQRHQGYGVKQEHYSIVGNCLLFTLETDLKETFTSETREAWNKFYSTIASLMLPK